MFVNCGVALPVADVERAMQRYRRAYEAHRRAVPGVVALLAHLHPRLRISVVTNGLLKTQQEKIVACKLEGFIDFLLTSEEVGVKKPDPRLFLLALEKAKTRREDAVVIGDSWTLDVLGAQQAGIRSLWLNRGQESCPDPRLTTELAAFEPLEHTLKALEAT
jgi:putative hydrolase of the HAD superfamily